MTSVLDMPYQLQQLKYQYFKTDQLPISCQLTSIYDAEDTEDTEDFWFVQDFLKRYQNFFIEIFGDNDQPEPERLNPVLHAILEVYVTCI